ncbi:MAG TPA: phosphodiester glycosidase family protein, partial [Patescibacteria group bacterium]|nr:phosphodiester glycosidase family protein [Patescibacteria group bacterium]
AAKVNTFLSPFFDSPARVMVNESSLAVHEGPLLAYSADGVFRYFHRAKDFGNSVAAFESAHATTLEAAASNYPALIEGGTVVVQSESRLDDGMKTIRGVRGGIGMDDRFVYLVIARTATVPDLADVMKALGATFALNLDGGGSAALWFGGSYAYGPGRLLPNAILFKKR